MTHVFAHLCNCCHDIRNNWVLLVSLPPSPLPFSSPSPDAAFEANYQVSIRFSLVKTDRM